MNILTDDQLDFQNRQGSRPSRTPGWPAKTWSLPPNHLWCRTTTCRWNRCTGVWPGRVGGATAGRDAWHSRRADVVPEIDPRPIHCACVPSCERARSSDRGWPDNSQTVMTWHRKLYGAKTEKTREINLAPLRWYRKDKFVRNKSMVFFLYSHRRMTFISDSSFRRNWFFGFRVTRRMDSSEPLRYFQNSLIFEYWYFDFHCVSLRIDLKFGIFLFKNAIIPNCATKTFLS